jgi:hypothetical protein
MNLRETEIEDILTKCIGNENELQREIVLKNQMISDLRDEVENLRSLL